MISLICMIFYIHMYDEIQFRMNVQIQFRMNELMIHRSELMIYRSELMIHKSDETLIHRSSSSSFCIDFQQEL